MKNKNKVSNHGLLRTLSRLKSKKGLTLIEVMIATVIFALILLAAFNMYRPVNEVASMVKSDSDAQRVVAAAESYIANQLRGAVSITAFAGVNVESDDLHGKMADFAKSAEKNKSNPQALVIMNGDDGITYIYKVGLLNSDGTSFNKEKIAAVMKESGIEPYRVFNRSFYGGDVSLDFLFQVYPTNPNSQARGFTSVSMQIDAFRVLPDGTREMKLDSRSTSITRLTWIGSVQAGGELAVEDTFGGYVKRATVNDLRNHAAGGPCSGDTTITELAKPRHAKCGNPGANCCYAKCSVAFEPHICFVKKTVTIEEGEEDAPDNVEVTLERSEFCTGVETPDNGEPCERASHKCKKAVCEVDKCNLPMPPHEHVLAGDLCPPLGPAGLLAGAAIPSHCPIAFDEHQHTVDCCSSWHDAVDASVEGALPKQGQYVILYHTDINLSRSELRCRECPTNRLSLLEKVVDGSTTDWIQWNVLCGQRGCVSPKIECAICKVITNSLTAGSLESLPADIRDKYLGLNVPLACNCDTLFDKVTHDHKWEIIECNGHGNADGEGGGYKTKYTCKVDCEVAAAMAVKSFPGGCNRALCDACNPTMTVAPDTDIPPPESEPEPEPE
ncbi:MAG: prepilin-type N-terminal cleavage/methylation domain-containing protein [Oscillospiraceae bacterium]|nr:prepilin-type N-terminal cleavage/methylation domain-containing protein [Oscillospiraceae bacterium]